MNPNQADIFGHPAPEEPPTLEERFAAFHKENPQVYRAIVATAKKLRANGFKRYGIAAIFEHLRMQNALDSTGDDYKLNNSYRAFYSRLIESREAELEDFFTKRKRSSDA